MQTTEILNEIKQNLLGENSIKINGKLYQKDGYIPSRAYLKRLEVYKTPFDSITLHETLKIKNEALSWYDDTIYRAKEFLKLIYGWGMKFSDAIIMDLKRRIQSIVNLAKVSIIDMIQDLRMHLGWNFYTVSTKGIILQPEHIYQAWLMKDNSRIRDLKKVLFNKN